MSWYWIAYVVALAICVPTILYICYSDAKNICSEYGAEENSKALALGLLAAVIPVVNIVYAAAIIAVNTVPGILSATRRFYPRLEKK